jgi:phosphosulfolactate synthase (CoM biosynthesis protein A)
MGKIVELQTGKNAVLIESSDVGYEGGVVQATGLNLQKNLDQMLERLQPFCESIIKNFEALSKKPTAASAEFGLNISGEGNLFVVKASGEATIKITLNWSINNR